MVKLVTLPETALRLKGVVAVAATLVAIVASAVVVEIATIVASLAILQGSAQKKPAMIAACATMYVKNHRYLQINSTVFFNKTILHSATSLDILHASAQRDLQAGAAVEGAEEVSIANEGVMTSASTVVEPVIGMYFRRFIEICP